MVLTLQKTFLLALLLTGAFALAQGGAGQPAAAAPPAAVKPEPKPEWAGTIGGGVQAEAGRTSQRGIALSGALAKSFTAFDTLSFEGQVNHASYKISNERFTAVNNHLGSVQYVRRFNNRFFLADRGYSSADTILGIKNRGFNAVGVGINLFLLKKGSFFIVPGYGFGYQNTSDPSIDGFHTGFASYEKFVYQLNNQWGLEQWSQVRLNHQHVLDRSIQGYIGVTAPALYKRLYLSMGVNYTYEGVLSPQAISGGATRNDAVFSVKVNYRIGR